MNIFINAIKGFFVGASMLIPGFSGGTMAMILGIYDKLISSLSGILDFSFSKNKNYFKNKKPYFVILIPFLLGSLIGIVLFSKPILFFMNKYGIITMYFFLGAAFGGIFPIYKKIKSGRFDFLGILFIVLGAFIVYGFSFMPSNMFKFDINKNVFLTFIMLNIAGIIAAVALILPGISVSYMLLLLGIYNETIDAIGNLYMPFLIPLGVGLILGIILTTKILSYAMTKHTRVTYLIIFGFIIGSIIEVFPGLPSGINLILCPLMFIIALFLIRFLQRFDKD